MAKKETPPSAKLAKKRALELEEELTKGPAETTAAAEQHTSEEQPSMIETPTFARRKSSLTNKNKQRCLILGTRQMSNKERYLLRDFHNLIPHSVSSNKVTVQRSLVGLMKELVELHSCNTTLLLHAKKKGTMMWVSQGKEGPSASFLLRSLTTSSELKMNGNCLKYSRPLLHFDKEFQEFAHLRVVQTLFNMIFGTPKNHPKSKPFIDHMFCFFYYDGHIWFRNYQISSEGKGDLELSEVGPRFVLSPIALLDGFFQGECIWKNRRPSPADISTDRDLEKASEYIAKKEAKLRKKHREVSFPGVPTEEDLLFS